VVESGYDLVVIGTGAAGTSAAARAVNLGARRVAIVEQGRLFGTCINVGCIPSKYLLAIANIHYYRGYGHAGLEVESRYDPLAALAGKVFAGLKLRGGTHGCDRQAVFVERLKEQFALSRDGKMSAAVRFHRRGAKDCAGDVDGIEALGDAKAGLVRRRSGRD